MFGPPTNVRARAAPLFERAAGDLGLLRQALAEVGLPSLSNTVALAERRLRESFAWLGDGELTTPGAPPGHPLAPGEGIARLRALADAFEGLVEIFEDEDPVANAGGIQVASLAFAILGATAARIERDVVVRSAPVRQ